jgi:hypothetical protein
MTTPLPPSSPQKLQPVTGCSGTRTSGSWRTTRTVVLRICPLLCGRRFRLWGCFRAGAPVREDTAPGGMAGDEVVQVILRLVRYQSSRTSRGPARPSLSRTKRLVRHNTAQHSITQSSTTQRNTTRRHTRILQMPRHATPDGQLPLTHLNLSTQQKDRHMRTTGFVHSRRDHSGTRMLHACGCRD